MIFVVFLALIRKMTAPKDFASPLFSSGSEETSNTTNRNMHNDMLNADSCNLSAGVPKMENGFSTETFPVSCLNNSPAPLVLYRLHS